MENIDFYISYNARHLNPIEVAQTFIISRSYEELIQNNHSVILGARGCGKTTLMKMLTVSALNSWKGGKKVTKIKQNMPFYAVYISTDIYWSVKNNSYGKQLEKFGGFCDLISQFSVNSSVFLSLCTTFEEIINLDLNDTDIDKEIELCNKLIEAWQLPKTIPKLSLVKESLHKRIDDVNQFIQKVIFNYNSESDINYAEHDYLNLQFISSLSYVLPIFERIYNISSDKRWALCFDELELAPQWLQDDLFNSLRSTNQKLLFKLSASPIISLQYDFKATSGNDLRLIKMWDFPEREVEKFSFDIISLLIKKKYRKKANLKDIFGYNERVEKDSYEEGSLFYNEVLELIQKDISFKNFLIKKGIDLEKPIPRNDKEKDTLFRKIKPIVFYRNYYIRDVKQNEKGELVSVLRPRKSNELYAGLDILCKICDGNPRWLIGVINSIFIKADGIQKINSSLQSEVLYETAKQFFNVISNIPMIPHKNFTLEKVINLVGSTFNKQILGGTFNMDPKGSFYVDKSQNEVADQIVDFLEKAAYQGAIILLNPNETAFDLEVRGKRFRLTYLLAPLYKLPLRTYTEIRLSQCLYKEEISTSQINIFDITESYENS